MWFTLQPATTERDVREDLTEHQQQEQEQDHGHDNHVMTDTHAYLQPAAVVAYQKEEMLK